MMNKYERQENKYKRIEASNKKLLDDFEIWLQDANLTTSTIEEHIDDVDLFIHDYLLYEDTIPPEDGIRKINKFFGYWFIKKSLWASESSIRSVATSLIKFYTFLQERGVVTKKDLSFLLKTIEKKIPQWVATLLRFDDPSITDMGEVWGK